MYISVHCERGINISMYNQIPESEEVDTLILFLQKRLTFVNT